MNKKEQRQLCRQARAKLNDTEKKEYSNIICEKLLPYLKDKTIMSYCSYNEEVDVNRINELFDVCLPVTYPDGLMEAIKPVDNRFIFNRLNIKEPDPAYGIKVDKKDIDVILVPLLGFDERRNRLGHGKGYYDRFLKDCKALKIGVAFSIQELDEVITDENDVKLDMIITEKEVH